MQAFDFTLTSEAMWEANLVTEKFHLGQWGPRAGQRNCSQELLEDSA